MYSSIMKFLWCCFLTIVFLGGIVSLTYASPITLDGKFADWDGQACMNDRAYDSNPSGDILKFYWATNDNESNLYFMIERRGWG
ncbi:MAG: hypothetical protein GXY40_12840, partial [Syntrophomonadaceae bacterium]|nr:hypothetical protein [Syntrophomonadaceae bacterium]